MIIDFAPQTAAWARHCRLLLSTLLVCGIAWPTQARSGFVQPLAVKVAEIRSACGSAIISGTRHTMVAGTDHLSLHASGRAADLRGNPRCIYLHLRGWTARGGGYSTDYSAVQHVHVSYGGREAGITFRHGGGHRHHRMAEWSPW